MDQAQASLSLDQLLDYAEKNGHAKVSYDWHYSWEPDPDVPPVYVGQQVRYGDYMTMRPRPGGYRRKRYIACQLPDGRTIGRWEWEKRSA